MRFITNMRLTIPLGRLFGIRILVHWSFFLIIVAVLYFNQDRISDWEYILKEVLFVFAIFGCVVLHELGHALAARKYGIETRRIMLLPIGGVAQLNSIPEKPSQELWIAIAGPLVNIGIAVLLSPIAFLMYMPGFYQNASFIEEHIVARLILCNIVLVIFNLIPAFPMDGGRILRAMLAFRMKYTRATTVAARLGQLLALGFAYLGFVYSPMLILTGVFVFTGAETERRMVKARHRFDTLPVKDIMKLSVPWINVHTPLREAITYGLQNNIHTFMVEAKDNFIGIAPIRDLFAATEVHGSDAHVGVAVHANIKTLSPDTSVKDALHLLHQSGYPILPVVEFGKVVGVIEAEIP